MWRIRNTGTFELDYSTGGPPYSQPPASSRPIDPRKRPGYLGSTSGYQGSTSGYPGSTSGYQGSTSGYQGSTSGYQDSTSGHQEDSVSGSSWSSVAPPSRFVIVLYHLEKLSKEELKVSSSRLDIQLLLLFFKKLNK